MANYINNHGRAVIHVGDFTECATIRDKIRSCHSLNSLASHNQGAVWVWFKNTESWFVLRPSHWFPCFSLVLQAMQKESRGPFKGAIVSSKSPSTV